MSKIEKKLDTEDKVNMAMKALKITGMVIKRTANA
jgi:hypothetical protein